MSERDDCATTVDGAENCGDGTQADSTQSLPDAGSGIPAKPKKRIEAIDALRGLSVTLMVVHHFLYDCVVFLGAPRWFFTNPVFDVLHYIFAGMFIFLSGVSSRFSRSNVRRGIIVLAIAGGLTFATAVVMPMFIDARLAIWFGVLHLLGFSMLFFGLTRKAWDWLPRKVAPALYILAIINSTLATVGTPTTFKPPVVEMFGHELPLSPVLFVLGLRIKGMYSSDYFPILPWLFVFLLGTWAGTYIAERRLPQRFYEARVPFFPSVGRKALLIYILHQPLLFALTMGIRYFFFREV
jgi:uncharacterized membrane protein